MGRNHDSGRTSTSGGRLPGIALMLTGTLGGSAALVFLWYVLWFTAQTPDIARLSGAFPVMATGTFLIAAFLTFAG